MRALKRQNSKQMVKGLPVGWIALVAALMFLANNSFAEEYVLEREKLVQSINPKKSIASSKSAGRAPANFIPDTEIEPVPMENRIWLQNVLMEDTHGVLASIRSDIHSWEVTEEYARNWSLESTGLYKTPDDERKKAVLSKKILRYFDKRLSGEIKNSEEGSTLHTVGQVHQTLRPNTEVGISKKIKVKFKARVLQGRAIMHVENPWVDVNANIKATGEVSVHFHKNIEELGIQTALDYNAREGQYIARVDRRLTETITARISSSQSDEKMMFDFDESVDRRLEIFYFKPF